LLHERFKTVQLLDREVSAPGEKFTQNAEGIMIGHHASRTGIFHPAEITLMQTTFDRICTQRKIAKESPAAEQLAKKLMILYQGGSIDDPDLTEMMRKVRAKRFSRSEPPPLPAPPQMGATAA
jgi:hypothetical protein